jgi:hypothetical protein
MFEQKGKEMPVPLGNFEDIMEVVELDIQWSFCVSK